MARGDLTDEQRKRPEPLLPPLALVLSGIVVGAFLLALVFLLTYLADPYSELQSIVFWLLGSLASATYGKVAEAAVPVLLGGALIYALR